jgi:uncharacterized lipoprotein YddW (UPF0748 family)
MKKPLLCLLLASAATAAASMAAPRPRGEALFVSMLQQPPVLASRQRIDEAVAFAARSGARTLFVQVYRENKAWFASSVADEAPYRAALETAGGDPLAYLIERAHAKGIEVHAWMNLLSLGANGEAPLLKRHGTGILTTNRAEKRALADYRVDGQYFLEPGEPRVREALMTLLGELLSAYPALDGVQFDYIRYPDWNPDYGYVPASLEAFARAGGGIAQRDDPSWQAWKRGRVTALVEALAGQARRLRPGIAVSTTALAPFSRAWHEGFQDWKGWVETGLVDFVTVMAYTPSPEAFDRYAADVRRQLGGLEKANLAVGAYAMLDDPDAFLRQWRSCAAEAPRACVAFHYGSLLEEPALAAAFGKTEA